MRQSLMATAKTRERSSEAVEDAISVREAVDRKEKTYEM
jgi:hypothetical protein